MGFGKQPSPPTLDYGASQRLTRADYELKEEFIPRLTDRTGDAGREEYARNLGFALRSFTNPASVIYSREIADANKELAAAREQAASMDSWRSSGAGGIFGVATGNQRFDPINKKWISNAEYDRLKAAAPQRVAAAEANLNRYTQADPVGDLQRTFAPEFAARDRLLGQMESAQGSTADFNNYQDALRRGIGAGQLGDSLMQSAMDKVASGGRLTPEASRDATQAARVGMAARGMATGNAGLAAEMLNRDRYTRQRDFENLNFASGVQAQDLNRRTANLGYLGQAAQNMDLERARQMSVSRDAYNFGLQTNPKMMLAGLGSPYANFTPQAIGLMGNQNVQPVYTGGSFGSSSGIGSAMGAGGALLGAGVGALLAAPTGGMSIPMGMALGSSLGGATGSLGGSFFR
jgi:hypothetical protein